MDPSIDTNAPWFDGIIQEDKRSNMTLSNQTNSPSLCLPAEMRDLIYEFTFHGYIRVYNAYAAHPPEEHAKFQVLHVCRQIRHEATPVLYRTCIFDLRALYEADIHAYHVGQHLTDMITSIRIPAGAAGELIDPSYSALTSGIYALPALKEVRIQGQVYMSLKPELEKAKLQVGGKEVQLIFETN